MRPRSRDDGPGPTQLGVLNVVPATLGGGGMFSLPKFATLSETFAAINEMFTSNPLPGSGCIFCVFCNCTSTSCMQRSILADSRVMHIT